jgi:hypothetical protein
MKCTPRPAEHPLLPATCALVPALWLACSSHSLDQLPAEPVVVTTMTISERPARQVDLLFMIDNSPSMAPKQEKLKAQFPKLMDALKDFADGSLPDLRVAIITSDLGTGAAYADGPCGPKHLPDGTVSSYGDLGRFQMIGAKDCGVTDDSALWLEYQGGEPANYTGDISDVFACLAGNVGTRGCDEEHSLQSIEFALLGQGIGNERQQTMVRPNAYLGLVILTDEDDCSAATNAGMFGDKPELHGESASLRCATRSHTCGGNNLSISGPGYPTSQTFSAPLVSCAARTDDCPNSTDGDGATDTSVPTDCSPLKDVKRLADRIKSLKTYPDEQILVAGIFGYPSQNQALADAQYKIGLVPNPNPSDEAHPQLFASWPVCYDANHHPASPDAYDSVAAGWGATAGLRISAFIDQFGTSGLKRSICDDNLASTLEELGSAFPDWERPVLCVDAKLFDTDQAAPGLQADCRVVYRRPVPDPSDPNKIVYREDSSSMPRCNSALSDDQQPAYPCWKVAIDRFRCPVTGQVISVVRAPSERKKRLPGGTKTVTQCLTCPDNGSDLPITGCDYSP